MSYIEARGPELPYNEEAEQALLGALLIYNDLLDRLDGLRPEHFFIPVHGRIFEAAASIIRRGGSADPITLRNHFASDQALSDVGGAGYLARLATQSVAPMMAEEYARSLSDMHTRRSLIQAAETCMARARDDYTVSGTEQLEALEGELFAMATSTEGQADTLGGAIDDMMDFALKQESGELVPVETGFSDLDRILDGLMPGDLTLCGGRPGMGKTGIGMAIALHNAVRNRPVGFIQLEMPKRQMAARAVSGMVNIPVKPILRGRLEVHEWENVTRAAKLLRDLPLIIDDRPGVALDAIISRARRMKRQHGIQLLVIDYLGLIKAGDVSEYERVTRVSQTMKELARTLDVHVLALHQLSRANEARENKRPGLADLRGSGALEQDADNVIFVYREEYYLRKEEPDPGTAEHATWAYAMEAAQGKAELIVDKQRNGSTGTALVRFDARTTTFRDQ